MTQQPEFRREDRYTTGNSRDIQISVSWDDTESLQPLQAELIDISANGARLSVASHLKSKQAVTILVESAAMDVDVRVAARVCWVRQTKRDGCIFGCKFDEELPNGILPRLAATGHIDQRQDARRLASVRGYLRQELVDDDKLAISVNNFSPSGLRFFSPKPVELKQRLMMNLETADGDFVEVVARSIWQMRTPAGYLVGCSFLNKRGFEAFAQTLPMEKEEPQVELPQERSLRMAPWIWIGLGAAVCWCAIQVFEWREDWIELLRNIASSYRTRFG